jgi:hypothetical protein
MRNSLLGLFALLCLCSATSGQTTSAIPSQSDPQALSLASQAVAALTGGMPISDVSLTATVTWTAGSDQESGTAILKARGTTQSRIDLALTTQRSEVRNDPSGDSYSFGPDSVWRTISLNNCWTDASWFFPALSSLANANNPNFLFTNIGQENRSGVKVQHIRVARVNASKYTDAAQLIQHLSTIDFYLDSSTLLPVAASFSTHAEDNASLDIAVTVGFLDYRFVNGVRVPFHVQRYIQGGLVTDITVSSVALNSGLPGSTFAAQ